MIVILIITFTLIIKLIVIALSIRKFVCTFFEKHGIYACARFPFFVTIRYTLLVYILSRLDIIKL